MLAAAIKVAYGLIAEVSRNDTTISKAVPSRDAREIEMQDSANN